MPRRNRAPDPTAHIWTEAACNSLAASLRNAWRFQVQSGRDKQKPPGTPTPEGFTDRRSEMESPGGCYAKSA